ncbi:hypothetical protein DV738_g486, partial [Chaetothyriales sp. CBS 135597]
MAESSRLPAPRLDETLVWGGDSSDDKKPLVPLSASSSNKRMLSDLSTNADTSADTGELHDHIFSFLDFEDAVHLGQTCQQFWPFVKPLGVKYHASLLGTLATAGNIQITIQRDGWILKTILN